MIDDGLIIKVYIKSNMKVWKDVFTGDAMASDQYRHKIIYSGAGLEIIGSVVQNGLR